MISKQRKVMRNLLLVVAMLLATTLTAQADNWKERASMIVRGHSTEMQKAKAVYNWMCDNVEHAVGQKVVTAEEVWEQKVGSSEGYANLYVKLVEESGLSARVIKGVSAENILKITKKSTTKKTAEHYWVAVRVDKKELLVDPMWGAGFVTDDGVYQANDNREEWFAVDPYWMIFTHYPDKKEDQMLSQPIELRRFKSLPTLYPYLGQYGLDGKQMYDLCMQRVRPPIFYDNYQYRPWTKVQLTNIPKSRNLIAGQTYTFEIEKIDASTQLWVRSSTSDSVIESTPWIRSGNHYTIHVSPTHADSLTLYIGGNQAISFVVEVSGFSVSDRQQVFFAPGNLRYDIKGKKYQFAAHQYDHPSSRSGKVEFFRWGTGNNPTLTDADISKYATFNDWGADVKPGKWRTLTVTEWRYLLSRRDNAQQKQGLATVCGHTGLVLLPDVWKTPKSCTFTPGNRRGYQTNIYTESQWKCMEQIGAVFLPAVGNLTYNDKEWGRNTYGRYWAATSGEDVSQGDAMIFSTDAVTAGTDRKSNGLAVRLVKEKKSTGVVAPKQTTQQAPRKQ